MLIVALLIIVILNSPESNLSTQLSLFKSYIPSSVTLICEHLLSDPQKPVMHSLPDLQASPLAFGLTAEQTLEAISQLNPESHFTHLPTFTRSQKLFPAETSDSPACKNPTQPFPPAELHEVGIVIS